MKKTGQKAGQLSRNDSVEERTERGVYAASAHELCGRLDRRRTHLLVRILKRRKRRAPSAEAPQFCGSKATESFRLRSLVWFGSTLLLASRALCYGVENQPCHDEKDQFQSPGVKDSLPMFRESAVARLTFPLSWLSGHYTNFDDWHDKARAKLKESLLSPLPIAPFEPMIISEQDRGGYVARKIVLNLTADSRVLALMTIPKGSGPYPAVLLLHDHGAKFDIGKEKVIRPWNEKEEKLNSAREWTGKYYGGKFLGDELAGRGYVCFATDMLNWSDRGGGGQDGQQALAANLFQLGTSFASVIAQEDLRAAEFLAMRPEVDRHRVAAMGLSVGGYRTWQLAALSDHISAGVSVCWMSTIKGLIVRGNNQTKGSSAYTMIHPGLVNFLDFPDVASIACPKPMMFLCGKQDKLFPLEAIENAYDKMRRVWDSQQAGDRLETRLYNVPHLFSEAMQQDAFEWLDRQLKVVSK